MYEGFVLGNPSPSGDVGFGSQIASFLKKYQESGIIQLASFVYLAKTIWELLKGRFKQ